MTVARLRDWAGLIAGRVALAVEGRWLEALPANSNRRPRETGDTLMDAPMCKLCNTRHWSREGHALPQGKPRAAATAKAPPPKKAKRKVGR